LLKGCNSHLSKPVRKPPNRHLNKPVHLDKPVLKPSLRPPNSHLDKPALKPSLKPPNSRNDSSHHRKSRRLN
jgi:hypothetical protein